MDVPDEGLVYKLVPEDGVVLLEQAGHQAPEVREVVAGGIHITVGEKRTRQNVSLFAETVDAKRDTKFDGFT